MKSLPKNSNLEYLKNEAKALRQSHARSEISCCDRMRDTDISFQKKTDSEIFSVKFTVGDSQRIIAREHGYSSWAKLKHFIESLNSHAYHRVSDKTAYHQIIVKSYDKRSKDYDDYVWARDNAKTIVEYCPPQEGDSVLDIATGSGAIAFNTAKLVGEQGSVIGIDISKGMLKRCNEKLAETNLRHLRFEYADAENLAFAANSFDRIYCSSAFFWMSHPLAALRHWYELLKPNAYLGFNAWPDNSFIWGMGARQSLAKFGVSFTIHEVTGNKAKTRELVELAGFSNVKIHEVKMGRYISVEDAKGPPLTLEAYSPGQYPHPIDGVSEEILSLAQKDFEAEIDRLVSDEGVWHDMTMYYVYGQKL